MQSISEEDEMEPQYQTWGLQGTHYPRVWFFKWCPLVKGLSNLPCDVNSEVQQSVHTSQNSVIAAKKIFLVTESQIVMKMITFYLAGQLKLWIMI